MYIRIRFARGREAMFMSHLDTMRTFTRAFRRTSIPIAYSEGFNPHAEMVFGLPLQVGVTSAAEYLDIATTCDIDAGAAAAELGAQLPAGLQVIAARGRAGKRNIMASVTHAAYEMRVSGIGGGGGEGLRGAVCGGGDGLRGAVCAFMRSAAFTMPKETKSGTRDTDIRPLVRSLEADGSELRMVVRAGSADNLKPSLLLEALNRLAAPGGGFRSDALHRAALYVETGGELADPLGAE